jgi:heme-degrading monooxygenase HmoA
MLRSLAALLLFSSADALCATPRLTAERYVATNRFRVKESRGPAFEKRWADRKSQLGLREGFRFFCMLRRTVLEGEAPPQDDINYISCTVWETQSDFDAWKTGDAFKEAHGGGTIGGIASMLLATARNTKGKPKAAMWEGLLPVSIPPEPEATGVAGVDDGWRLVEADGQSLLDGEAFVAMNRFRVAEGREEAFESRFASRESKLSSYDGFKGFLLLRRDGDDPDGFTHSTWSLWRDRAAFEAWRGSENRAGKQSAPPGPPSSKAGADGDAAPPAGGDAGGDGGKPPPSLFQRPPVPSFYEGILCLESAKGI